MAFSKEVARMLFEQHGQTLLRDGGGKKGTLIFTGTLGAMRTNANFAAYGASRSGARSLAQALAKEYSPSKLFFRVGSFALCVLYKAARHSEYPSQETYPVVQINWKRRTYTGNPRWYTCRTRYHQWVSTWPDHRILYSKT